jgi:large subunit ribosomal protein L41
MHPTQPLFRTIRRLALNTKQAGKDFYKGNRTGSMEDTPNGEDT